MKLLRALKEIPSNCGPIPAGADFYEPNPEMEAQWIRTGYAIDPLAIQTPEMAIANPPIAVGLDTPLDWSYCDVVIIAGGESVTADQCSAVFEWMGPTRKVVAINTSFRMAPFADVVYACDGHYWTTNDEKTGQTYLEEMLGLGIERRQMWTQDRGAAKKLGINFVQSERGEGLNKKKNIINQGASGGYQAIGLAVQWGAKKIYLLGFDCKGGHWHGDHPAPINARLPHKMWLENFAKLAPDLKAAGVEVINCSPDSALKVFPQKRLEEALCSPSAPSDHSRTTGAMLLSTDSSAPATSLPIKGSQKTGATSSSLGTGTE